MSTFDSNTYFTQNGTYKAINPLASRVGLGDFTPFYIAIAICSVILGSILVLNVICCCSRYSDYWLDRHTGNRWIVSIWSATPHKQPPLDLTELEFPTETQYVLAYPATAAYHKESEVHSSLSQQPLASRDFHMPTKESDL